MQAGLERRKTGSFLIAFASLGIWLYLVLAHGRFWSSAPELQPRVSDDIGPFAEHSPPVDIVVPARDEVETIGPAVASLLAQTYSGGFRVIVVDDSSTDGTAAHAGVSANLIVHSGLPKPPGWSGKLWALSQGVSLGDSPLILFTDADIVHDPRHLATLVAALESRGVGLVSEMVRLNCASLAEKSLVPAFVYFFQMLYPFASVNDRASRFAAAAGGTVLMRRAVLQRIGGIESIKGALIDDVTLARAVKPCAGVYLGHSGLAASIRPYPDFLSIGRMITRTAFTQLRHSALLLTCALAGMALVWWVPLAAALFERGWPRYAGVMAYVLATASYLPTLFRYGRSAWWSLLLPFVALFYMGATLVSALNYWRGAGATWKAREYREPEKS